MRFKFNVFGRTVLATTEQLEAVYAVIRECQVLHDVYVGGDKGLNGGAYIQTLQAFPMMEMTIVGISDAEYATLELITELRKEEQNK